MVEMSLLERIGLVFSLIFSSPLFLILILGIAIMLVDAFVISKKSRTTKIAYIIISIISILILLHNYYDSFFSVLDIIAKNIVTIIYFPSVLEYIIILIVSLIIILISSLSKKTNKVVKFINLSVFAVNMVLFFLILDEISNNNIDLANKVSVYTNQNLMALFESSVIIFSIWIIGLILYKLINKLSHKKEVIVEEENTFKEEDVNPFYGEAELPKTIEELRKEELIPPPQIEYVVVEKKKDNEMFTLDEYRALKKVLESIKEQN